MSKICYYYACIILYPPEFPEKREGESLMMTITGYAYCLNMSWFPYHVI